MRKIFLLSAAAIILAGCATWTQLEPREYEQKASGFKAEMPQDWMRYNLGPNFLMTKDGTTLEMIWMERVPFDKKLEHTKKKYFEGMSVQELADIEIDNLSSDDKIGNVLLLSNKPKTLNGRKAFCLEYTYTTSPSGLKVRGIKYGFVEGKWIYRIGFEAAEQYYFKKTRPAFDRFIGSFKVY